jgi:hypothetical protein
MGESRIDNVSCRECGLRLDELTSIPADARSPCPACGSTTRTIAVGVAESMRTSDHVSALQERGDVAIGFSESERQGLASGAMLDDLASVKMSLVGSSPQGEDDTWPACQVLKERLNASGGNWDRLIHGREPADCVLVDALEPKKTLEVQVVRAISSQDLWRRLNVTGSVQLSLTSSEVAAEIQSAIRAKAFDERIPRSLRSGLVLALDATRLPGLALDQVVSELRATSQDWVRSHGFAGVWLVGPVPRLVWRLD